MLVLVFILELAAGISGYILKGQTYHLLTTTINATMFDYGEMENHTDLTVAWDHLQTGVSNLKKLSFLNNNINNFQNIFFKFECCGLHSYKDWHTALNNKIPMSCCKPQFGAIDEVLCRPDTKTLFSVGCISSFGDFINSHTVTLAAVGVTLAVLQVIL